MVLKEAFRFQKFLDGLFQSAQYSISDKSHALTVTKTHLRSLANAEAEDKVEIIDNGVFCANDDVIAFMQFLIQEKFALSCAIGKAKASIEFDIDAAVETNKYRQNLRNSVNGMLRNVASKKIERGTDYKFNVEGNQMQYAYDVEVDYTEAFNRNAAKIIIRGVITEADKISRAIDSAMIDTDVEYTSIFDVNDSFEDAMEIYLSIK